MLSEDAVQYRFMRQVFDLTPNCVSIRNASGTYIMVNQAQADAFGTTVDEMVGTTLWDYHSDARAAELLEEDAEVLRTRRTRVNESERWIDPAGVARWYTVTKRAMVLPDGASDYVLTIAVDVSTRKHTEVALRKSNDFLTGVMQNMNDAVFALDLSGTFTLVNRRLCEIAGYADEELIGEHVSMIFDPNNFALVGKQVQRCLLEGIQSPRFMTRVRRKDGADRALECSLSPLLSDGSIAGIIATGRDVTEQEAAEHRIAHLAHHDPVTDLPNRRLFDDRLRLAMKNARRTGETLALLLLDFDRFKRINDLLGHSFGDRLLQDTAERLKSCVRTGDTIARMGGDELMIILTGIASVDHAAMAAQKILATIRAPFTAQDGEVVLTASVGIAIYPSHAGDAEGLIRCADAALLAAKHRGRDTYQVFDPGMGSHSLDHLWFEGSLRKAIAAQQFELFYQPIVNVRNGGVHAFEALVRWRHPDEGLLLPSRFIHLAEDTGLIEPLGEWVLHEACRQGRCWHDAGWRDVRVAVNISPHQFRGPLRETVVAALDRSGLSPEGLELEITETTIMENAERHTTTMRELKELGIYLSIDDFGTGYSSLAYLKRFPINTLKIDRAFMPQPDEADSGAIAAAVISMAHSLSLDVIAEGVETEAQHEFLRLHKCDFVQGFLHSPPMTAAEASEFLRR